VTKKKKTDSRNFKSSERFQKALRNFLENRLKPMIEFYDSHPEDLWLMCPYAKDFLMLTRSYELDEYPDDPYIHMCEVCQFAVGIRPSSDACPCFALGEEEAEKRARKAINCMERSSRRSIPVFIV